MTNKEKLEALNYQVEVNNWGLKIFRVECEVVTVVRVVWKDMRVSSNSPIDFKVFRIINDIITNKEGWEYEQNSKTN